MRVLEPGLLTTVQDLGRPGHAHLGVSAAGAADPISLRIGNRLVGNPDGAAALEMTLTGVTIRFEAPALVALTGADFGPRFEIGPRGSRQAPAWTALAVEADDVLVIGATRSGARAYLCVRGGIATPPALDSRSTHLATGLGGLEGRALRRGDRLAIGGIPTARPGALRVAPAELHAVLFRRELRVTQGLQWERFTPAARQRLMESPYEVTEESDRAGLRLAGPPLQCADAAASLTEGVSAGVVQVPGNGQPIVLFVDQQTTGGYPKIAAVIAADLPALGQLRPRQSIRFQRVDLAAARALLAAQEALLETAVDPW
jgi:antagonist of KipI